MSDRWYPPPSWPRPVEDGLKARSTRGTIAQTWWSQRFVEVLEDIGLGSRLQRGRSYARKGQVISLDVDAGRAIAQVQGSRARPYRVRISLTAFGKAEWAQVERGLGEDAWYSARLLAGEMPEDIGRNRPAYCCPLRELAHRPPCSRCGAGVLKTFVAAQLRPESAATSPLARMCHPDRSKADVR